MQNTRPHTLLIGVIGVTGAACGGTVQSDPDGSSQAIASAGPTGGNTGSGGGGGAGGAGMGGIGGGDPPADPGCGAPGSTWDPISALTDGSGQGRRQIWGSAPDDVWVVGPGEGEARHFNGADWEQADLGLEGFSPSAISGSAADEVFVASPDGSVLRFNGSGWQFDGALMSAPALWAWGSGEALAVGASATFMKRTAGAWTAQPLDVLTFPRAIGGSSGADVFAVGDSGLVMHYNGSGWTQLDAPAPANLVSVWSLGPGEAVAGGEAGQIMRLTPSEVTSMEPLPEPYTGHTIAAVWAAGPKAIFALGSQTLFFHDGSQWHTQPMNFIDQGAALWGSSVHDVYVVGGQFAIRRCSR